MGMYAPGDYVKVEFQDARSGHSEWMWVKVDRADDSERVVFGWLDNEPLVNTSLRLGQEIAMSYDLICEHMKTWAFAQ